MGLMFKAANKWGCTGFKMVKELCNVAYYLWHTATEYYRFTYVVTLQQPYNNIQFKLLIKPVIKNDHATE